MYFKSKEEYTNFTHAQNYITYTREDSPYIISSIIIFYLVLYIYYNKQV